MKQILLFRNDHQGHAALLLNVAKAVLRVVEYDPVIKESFERDVALMRPSLETYEMLSSKMDIDHWLQSSPPLFTVQNGPHEGDYTFSRAIYLAMDIYSLTEPDQYVPWVTNKQIPGGHVMDEITRLALQMYHTD